MVTFPKYTPNIPLNSLPKFLALSADIRVWPTPASWKFQVDKFNQETRVRDFRKRTTILGFR